MLYGLTAPNWSNYLRKPKGRRRRPIPTDRARYGAADRAGGRQDRANHRPGRELLSYSDARPNPRSETRRAHWGTSAFACDQDNLKRPFHKKTQNRSRPITDYFDPRLDSAGTIVTDSFSVP